MLPFAFLGGVQILVLVACAVLIPHAAGILLCYLFDFLPYFYTVRSRFSYCSMHF